MAFMAQMTVPKNLDECLKSQGDSLQSFPVSLFCNATWDTVLCWPPSLRGSSIKLPCPAVNGVKSSGVFAIKNCGVNGQWMGQHPGKSLGWSPGWTNYSNCMGVNYGIKESTNFNITNVAPISLGVLPVRYDGANVIACILLSVSIIFAMAALGISFFSKGVQPTRNRILRNLFAALLFHDILELVVNVGRTMKDANAVQDVETCVAIGVIVTLTSSALFVWTMIVGICFTMTLKGYAIERRIYLVLCLLGWFVPTVITTTWLSVTVLGGKLHCWFAELYIADLESSFWIVEVCNIFFLLCSWLSMLHFLVKYNNDDRQRCCLENNKELSNELSNIKSSARKVTFILGYISMTYLVYLLYAHWPFSENLTYLFVLCVYSRGIVVPLVLCFLEETCYCWDGTYKVTVISDMSGEDSCENI